ncbi:FMN-binding negative transcriptional regulator [Granulicella sibirica]|uniref:Transcriptional regulator n=1 Tax=Granulicella sibirica TaxID=2479048 RepID=A0A4Q0T8V7_9BACT|nr:FMN-binding negative transcriptional regulator [Granulicella sibirica]RXH58469.1 Transcriptional regulator [Granulicella sibirica]
MYIPRANEEKRVPVIHRLMAEHPLASLVTLGSSGLFATHLPVVIEQDGSEFGVLKGHISRANRQAKDLVADVDALAIFAGPQHYISATWYPGKLENGEEVPTWNYAVVHAYGPLRVVEDAVWMRAHLESLTDRHEAALPVPWKVSDAPEAFIRTMMNGIVGLEMPIRRLEGKWKMSQNRTERDRAGVLQGLASLGTPESRVIGQMVEAAPRGKG